MEGADYVRLWEGALSKCKLDSIDSELGLTYNFREHDEKLLEFIRQVNARSTSATISISRMILIFIHSIFQYLVSVARGLQEIRVTDS